MSLPKPFCFMFIFVSFATLNGCDDVKNEGGSISDTDSEDLPAGCSLPASHEMGGVQVQMELEVN